MKPVAATRLLAIETASTACSAALYIDGEVEERHALAPRQHAALILPMVESLLVEAGLNIHQLDAVAFGRGPGSFTGVRIAASVVQGIALGADLPVVAVSSLATLALGAMRETGLERVMAALDARMQEVYWGVYQRDGRGLPVVLGKEYVCSPTTVVFPDAVAGAGAGSGWDTYAEDLMQQAGERILRVLPDLEPRALDVANLGADQLQRGITVRAEEAIPVYLRDQVVQRN